MSTGKQAMQAGKASIWLVRLVVAAANGSALATVGLWVLVGLVLVAVIVIVFVVILAAFASLQSSKTAGAAGPPCVTVHLSSEVGSVPPGFMDAAAGGQAQYGVPADVLIAHAYVETQLGRAQTGQPDNLIPDSIRQYMDVAGLAKGGAIARAMDLSDGRRPGDYVPKTSDVATSDISGPVTESGPVYRFGLYHTLPNQWWRWSMQALGHVGDPNNPADAVLVDAWYLGGLMAESGGGLTVSDALGRVSGDSSGAYAKRVMDLIGGTLTASSTGCSGGGIYSAGNPFGTCHPTTTQHFGPTDVLVEPAIHGYPHFHAGLDIVCPPGSAIFSVTDGIVYHVAGGCQDGAFDRCGGGYGNSVVVKFRMALPGDTQAHDYFLVYAHMRDSPMVQEGQSITAGTQLGVEGSTGLSTGAHLHFEVDADSWHTAGSVDPQPLLAGYINPNPGPPLG